MAILGDIRKRTGLLIVVIGVAMLAFVAGDLFSDESVVKRLFTGDPNEVGNINGVSISVGEYLNAQNNMRSNPNLSQNQISQQIWSGLVAQKLIGAHTEKAGLEVSDDQVWAFMARQYGMGSAEELKIQIGQLKGQAEQGVPNAGQTYQNFLMMFEEARPNLLNQQYMEMVNMAIVTTNFEAAQQQISNIQSANIDYAFASYEDLEKKFKVEVTDSEIIAYMKKFPKYYEAEASVDLSYVYFPGKASEADEAAVKNSLSQLLTQSIVVDEVNGITDTIAAFGAATNDSIYVNKYSERPFNAQFISKKELEQFKGQLPEDYYEFLTTASVGQVGGPFKTGDAYQLVKLSKTKEIADSINSSHILISYAGTSTAQNNPSITRNRDEARALADSIKNMANAGNFKTLVATYSEDLGSKAKDGNIGYTSRTSQNLAPEYLQFLNENSTGTIGVTESQFGFHIIKIDGVKNQMGYQFANIIKEVKASQNTSDANFTNARNFAQEVQGKSLNDFANAAQKAGYNYNTVDNVERYHVQALVDPSTGFGNDRDNDILKWAFSKDTKVGSTNLFSTVNEDQIIVYVAAKSPKGLAPVKAVRSEIEPILIQEKLLQTINSEMSTPSIDTFVSKFGAAKSNSAITFGATTLAGKGPQPKVAGATFGLKNGQTSKAIAGTDGIYVINLKSMSEKPEVKDASFLVDQLTQQKQQEIMQGLIPSMIMSADVKDNRMKILDRQQM
ncbi:MAG TPA: peptidylprolyl isomerase [Moheibacter sp.]|nr:peptidylprolyl isomerase [Moheibacter sp.]